MVQTVYIDNSVFGGCFDEEADELAFQYISEGKLSKKLLIDARQIAIASINKIDIIVSWNFKHIVNLDRIKLYNSVNLKNGYPLIEIRSPRDIIHE